jgi:hypothetical protein
MWIARLKTENPGVNFDILNFEARRFEALPAQRPRIEATSPPIFQATAENINPKTIPKLATRPKSDFGPFLGPA